MLIARLLGYIRQAKTLHIFLLEILAVFIGITGSLFVDNWRSERAEHEVLSLNHLWPEFTVLLNRASAKYVFWV